MASGQPEANKLRVRADPGRLMGWLDAALRRRPVQVVVVGLVVVGIVLLLAPLSNEPPSVGHKLSVGARAETNLKATRDFDYYPSAAQLERKRAEAAARVLTVFDHEADMGAILLSRINRAFEAVTAAEGTDAGSTADPAREGTSEGRRAAGPAGRTARLDDERDVATRFAAALHTSVSPETYELLRRSNFSAEVRATLVVLASTAMDQLVVANRGVLAPFQPPVVIRHLVGGRSSSRGEERLATFNRLRDLQQLREQVRQQANIHGAKLSPPVRRAVVALVESLLVPNLTPNPEETSHRREEAREGVTARAVSFVKGQIIVRDGDPLSAEHLRIIGVMESAYRGVSRMHLTLVALGLLVLVLLLVVLRFTVRQMRRFLWQPRDLLAMGVLLVTFLGLARAAMILGAQPGAGDFQLFPYLVPLAAAPMLVRLLVGAEAAALFTVVLATLAGLLLERSLGLTVYYLVTGLIGAGTVARIQSRSALLRAGLASGLVGAVMALALALAGAQPAAAQVAYAMLLAVGGGLFAGFAALALLPALEWLFGYITDVTLLELANLNHPLLRELMLRAPGTYHHSMVVGSLSEAACEAIGANGLLARVACNYHDVGKMKSAAYFGENFKNPADSPHQRLKPSMSALIIRNHVRDTIEMLREHRVPEIVISTAVQHHGTTLIEYFHRKAQEQKETDEEIQEEDYRYPGPKPQSREAGVIMLADAVEAAARSLAEPTEDRLRGVVQRVTNTKFTDGQLDHCDLTLRDLHTIAKSFLQVLRGIYHQRPTYPWQREKADDAHHRRGEETKRVSGTLPAQSRDKKDKAPAGAGTAAKSERAERGETKNDAQEGEPPGGGGGSETTESDGSYDDQAPGSADIRRLGIN